MSITETEATPEVTKAQQASQLEISVSRDALLSELAFASSVAETKTTIPILSFILLEATEHGVTLTATDLERSVVTSVPARVKKTGTVLIHARKLFDYIRLLGSGVEITIKSLENFWVQIRAGRSNTRMVGMAPANFPQVQTSGGLPAVKLPVYSLKLLLSQTAFAVSREESRYTLNGALFGLESDKLYMVSTDGHRLAQSQRIERVQGLDEKFTVLVPKRALEDLQSLLSVTEESEVTFAKDEKSLFFTVGHRQYRTSRLSGQFPNYQAVIPTANSKVLRLSVTDTERAIRRVATFADERSGGIRLTVSQDTLTVSASSSENGESEEAIETKYSGEQVVIGFNSAYILDFLKILGGDGEVLLKLKDGQSSALFVPNGSDHETELIYVVMPMRVGN